MKKVEANKYPYKFSIIFSIYNAEKYIDEAVASIVNQTIGFEENVQLIMVDDGSPDRCGEICDRYGEKYPNNVVVVHRENGGLSRARNMGLEYATGRYVNFCDPDDILSPETLERVYEFFDRNDRKMDVVAIPMMLFGTANGPHHLNDKFAKGTRIINLEKEYMFTQLSVASSFIKNEVAKRFRFNPDLPTAEDAEQLTKFLMDKHFLGVVADCQYNYRRYGTSLVAEAPKKKAAYGTYLKLFSLELLEYAERKFGYIPRFVQNTVMCDLQWKLQFADKPEILTDEEFEEYRALLHACLEKIDDEVIMRQRSLSFDIKMWVLAHKDGKQNFISRSYKNIYYGEDYRVYHSFSHNALELNFLEMDKETIQLSLRQSVLQLGDEIDAFYIMVNNQRLDPVNTRYINNVKCLGELVSRYYVCNFEIPRSLLTGKSNAVTFHSVLGETEVFHKVVRTGSFFPVTSKYRSAYYTEDGLMFTLVKNMLMICPTTAGKRRRQERRYLRELWRSDDLGARKAVFARLFLRFCRPFMRKEIWLISDRLNKCGDNGEAFFRYLKQIRFKKAKYYYVINEGTGYDMMKPLGNVIKRDSWKYKLLHLACTNIISSHADDFVINPFSNYSTLYQDIMRRKNFIFLQHGITQNDISGWLNRYNKDIKGFVCAAYPEHRSIIDGTYYYTEKDVWLTGFARFDRLYHDEKRYVTLMPTWRRYLMGAVDPITGVWSVSDAFCQSEYFQYYNALINDERLLAAAKEYGYTICYMPHPNTITKIDLFQKNEQVKFFSIDDEYRDVYAQSDLVLTDYSSAAFDFAYLRKPIVYTQFDKEEFFGGKHVCTQGYFSYERDGFGEVTYDLDSTVDVLIDYMKNNCQLKDVYRERIDKFFAFNDHDNCKRILEKILELRR